MKRALRKPSGIYHYKDGERIYEPPDGVRGDLTGVRGDLTWVRGDLTGVSGDLTGVRGGLTGVSGDVDACQLTSEERARGVNVADLLEETQ